MLRKKKNFNNDLKNYNIKTKKNNSKKKSEELQYEE